MEKTKKGGSFLKQAAILAAAGILVRVIGFLYRLPLTSLIHDEGNSLYASGYYIYQFLLILSSAGFPAAISKMVSERLARREFTNAHNVFRVSMMVGAILGLICAVFLAIFAKPLANIIQSPGSYYSLLTLAPTLFVVAILSVYRGYFQGMKTMMPTAISQVIEQVFNAVFSVYLAYLLVGKGVEYGAAGGTAGTGIGALAGLLVVIFFYYLIKPVLVRRMKKEKRIFRQESTGEIARTLMCTAIPIIAGTAVFSITNLADMFMVKSRLIASGAFTMQEIDVLYGQLAGKYATLTTLPVSITTAMATAAIPSIAKSVVLRDKKTVKNKINMTFRIAMIISIPASVGIGVLGDQILLMLFPTEPGGGMLLKVGAVSIIFLSLCQIITGILQGISKMHIPVIGAIAGAVVKIILNYVLIIRPEINVLGAVISTTACYAVASIINLVFLTKITRVKTDLVGSLGKPLLSSLIMGLCCYYVYQGVYHVSQNNTLGTWVAIFISIIVYGVFMALIKGLKEEDLKMFPGGNKLFSLFARLHLM